MFQYFVETSDSPVNIYEGRLTLSQFNVERVLKHGASLMGSEGKEYDVQEASLGKKMLFFSETSLTLR